MPVSDLRDALRRRQHEYQPAPGAFDRLVRRRHRKATRETALERRGGPARQRGGRLGAPPAVRTGAAVGRASHRPLHRGRSRGRVDGRRRRLADRARGPRWSRVRGDGIGCTVRARRTRRTGRLGGASPRLDLSPPVVDGSQVVVHTTQGSSPPSRRGAARKVRRASRRGRRKRETTPVRRRPSRMA